MSDHPSYELTAVQVEDQDEDDSQYNMDEYDGEINKIVVTFIYTPEQSVYLKAAQGTFDCPFFHAYMVMLANEFELPHLAVAA